MSLFFAGRLWVSPATVSTIDDSALLNKNLSVGNRMAVIGQSEGGEPGVPIVFANPSEARKLLRSDEAAKAVERAFDPSSQTGAPAEVIFMRVNPAVQAQLMLKSAAAADVILLKSTDYGLYTNQVKIKVESGTNAGKKITTQLGNDYYSADDITRSAFSIQYIGAEATGVMSITGTQITLQAPSGTTVATVDLATYDTIQKVVDYINTIAGFDADVLDGNGNTASLNGLDYVTTQDVKTALYTAKADLQAVVDWFNGQAEGFVTATRQAGVGAVPANLAFTYLAGGSNGTVTNTEWSNALQALQLVDVQWVVGLSSSASIHAMVDTHCAFMSTIGRMERRAIHGTATGTTDAAAIAAAKLINSDRSSLTHLGVYDFNQSGALTLYPPYIAAACMAGALAGSNPGTSLTNKSLKIRGLERKLRNPTDTDALIKGGVLCIEDTPNGFKVVKSITTWLNDSKYNRVEISTGVALDFTARNVRQAVDVLRGEKGSPQLLSRAENIAEATLIELARPEPNGPGVIVGDEENPAYRNITTSIDGDVVRIDFECSPVIPANYMAVTIYAVPFSGTARA